MQHTAEPAAPRGAEAADAGLGGVMLFGVPTVRDAVGSRADDPDGVLNVRASRDVRRPSGGRTSVVMADLCLDEFTDHGHCGVLTGDGGAVDNDATLVRYVEMALAQARAGVGPARASRDDGRPDRRGPRRARRRRLHDTSSCAYGAKYASAFYGPFRDAVDSELKGDRKTYQMDPANARRVCARPTSTSPRAPTS